MKKYILYLLIMFVIVSCKKQDEWLNVKSNKADIIPKTLQDYQAILDNNTVMNSNFPAIGIISADNGNVSDLIATTGGTLQERNAYKWASDIYEGGLSGGVDWIYPYKAIEYANVVLDGLKNIDKISQSEVQYNNIKGSALFYRAVAFYALAQIYIKPYNSETAASDPGLLLRISSDVNVRYDRATVQKTYEQIIDDLSQAVSFLPLTPVYKTRPSVPAAQMMLAKVYLNMSIYDKAKSFADLVLNNNNTLLDFNTLNTALTYPLPTFKDNNPEILFFNLTLNYSLGSISNRVITSELYNSYNVNDLRKTIFFRTNTDATHSFRGAYCGSSETFCGLSLNELILIRAECLARTGHINDAMADLNLLLSKRWKKNSSGNTTYINQTANSENEALEIILNERRKELPFTGNLRWEDLRRLNSDSRFAKTLSRTILGQIYTLAPNDPKYTLPIPPSEISINPVIQNPR
ncbi:RagB/SusD family nutrient uptake outer membrane protein [Pedobacter alluvionis]|uniref:RagB/SusD family nutrient uptake outer membrane protein n=1 Tax=Pedobacter alluvionis TaxID=475253 RepID=A0A497Y0Y9_9SPHI|nr:RagB/SusD family nutrient uptake outer membrane protein [Pedobacter alluvionis]RLJ75144.1 SusD-like starch-binding protein associating with outer membrane [Pedobacter alluvionis]TFB30247.1 RagB/SusD family nutrient uptake outer membrane protein [Pedobacter alluvionis]